MRASPTGSSARSAARRATSATTPCGPRRPGPGAEMTELTIATALACMLASGALYLLGPVGTTMAGNVPLNDALARVEPADADAAARWRDYARRWTALNHLRVALGVAAAVLLAAAAV